MVKVSVIIPVYNGEKYIKPCLDSVFKQTLEEIEVIVINDASKDNTISILNDYKNKFPNKLKIIEKEKNEGQGVARNKGIDLASGEFLTFVDSDDTIENDMLRTLYEEAIRQEADVVVCDYYEIKNDKKEIKKAIPQKTQDIKKDYVISIAGPCNKLICTELLKKYKLHFLETGIYEDISMIPLIGIYAKKIVYIEKPYYNYLIREGSTMRQKTFNKKLLSIYNALECLSKGFKESSKQEQYKDELEFIYIKHLLYGGTGRFLEYKEGKTEVKKINKIIKEKFPSWRKNIYYKKQGKLFKLNCNIFYSNNLLLISILQKLKSIVKG